MIEYELSVKMQVEDEAALENMLITVESLDYGVVNLCATELVNINLSDIDSGKPLSTVKNITDEYEADSWMSPILSE